MDELHQMAERLQRVQHFQRFSMPDLIGIVSFGQIRHFREGEMIFR